MLSEKILVLESLKTPEGMLALRQTISAALSEWDQNKVGKIVKIVSDCGYDVTINKAGESFGWYPLYEVYITPKSPFVDEYTNEPDIINEFVKQFS